MCTAVDLVNAIGRNFIGIAVVSGVILYGLRLLISALFPTSGSEK